jgi:hypothetical protein
MKNRCNIRTKKGKLCKKYKSKNEICCSTHRKNNLCTICLDDIKQIKRLHCSHSFCSKCISKWIHIEQKDTCPLCREFLYIEEEYDAFEFCLYNKLLTIVVYYEYHIDSTNTNNTELIEYIEKIMFCDNAYDILRNPHTIMYHDEPIFEITNCINSYYNRIEWETIINYIKRRPELYSLFLNCELYCFNHYQIFDINNQGVIQDGKSYIYNFKINLI